MRIQHGRRHSQERGDASRYTKGQRRDMHGHKELQNEQQNQGNCDGPQRNRQLHPNWVVLAGAQMEEAVDPNDHPNGQV
jgi:hypothetical protein